MTDLTMRDPAAAGSFEPRPSAPGRPERSRAQQAVAAAIFAVATDRGRRGRQPRQQRRNGLVRLARAAVDRAAGADVRHRLDHPLRHDRRLRVAGVASQHTDRTDRHLGGADGAQPAVDGGVLRARVDRRGIDRDRPALRRHHRLGGGGRAGLASLPLCCWCPTSPGSGSPRCSTRPTRSRTSPDDADDGGLDAPPVSAPARPARCRRGSTSSPPIHGGCWRSLWRSSRWCGSRVSC